ncbi:hypothetical protein AB205_0190130 [Aquarana catesbeiana]|uniref:Uncharacterized protein n=1 Tax=Aquarana catesbeiana TaxID=8400 RepID=A0A2G9PQT5_AQUCT|nr:hypothetical protein AB205_0190130 [Aquarana catesbeiana]
MFSAWNSAKTDNCMTLQAMFHIPISGLKYLWAKYTYFLIHIGEKRLGTSEVTRDPQPLKEWELTTPQPEDVEEGEVYEVGEIVTTTGDVDVVEDESQVHASSSGRSWCAIVIYRRSRKTSVMWKKDSKTSLMF